jgi:hypothetical protein
LIENFIPLSEKKGIKENYAKNARLLKEKNTNELATATEENVQSQWKTQLKCPF